MKRPFLGIFFFEVNKNLRKQITLNPRYAKNVIIKLKGQSHELPMRDFLLRSTHAGISRHYRYGFVGNLNLGYIKKFFNQKS